MAMSSIGEVKIWSQKKKKLVSIGFSPEEIAKQLDRLHERIMKIMNVEKIYNRFSKSEILADIRYIGYCDGILEINDELRPTDYKRLNELWKKYK